MTVLLLGRQTKPGLLQAEMLRNAGIEVIFPSSRREALAAISRGNFDVAVLPYSLSTDTTVELAELLRQRCPACPLVVIANTDEYDPKISPEAVVLVTEGPEALVAAVRRLGKPQELRPAL
jgi:CheY-like chemotaxis protein